MGEARRLCLLSLTVCAGGSGQTRGLLLLSCAARGAHSLCLLAELRIAIACLISPPRSCVTTTTTSLAHHSQP
jgi:hypothetical protein